MVAEIFVKRQANLLQGNGQGILRPPSAQRDFHTFLSKSIPPEKRLLAVEPEYNTPTDVGGNQVFKNLRNLFGPPESDILIPPRNASAAAATYSKQGVYAGAPALVVPSSGAAVTPYVPGGHLNPDAFTMIWCARITSPGTSALFGYSGSSFTGTGAYISKTSTLDQLSFQYNGATAVTSAFSVENVTHWGAAVYDKDTGVKMLYNGDEIGGFSGAIGPAANTTFQLFAVGTGAGAMTGYVFFVMVVNDNLLKTSLYPDMIPTIDEYLTGLVPLGA